jgi:hypothetical protein
VCVLLYSMILEYNNDFEFTNGGVNKQTTSEHYKY